MPNNSDYTYGDDMGQMEQDMMSGDIIPDGGPLESKDFIVQDLEYLNVPRIHETSAGVRGFCM